MGRTGCRRSVWLLGTVLMLGLALPDSATAQGSGFSFNRPKVTLGLQLGYSVPRAGSEIFDFTYDYLTIEKSDFNAPHFGGELGVLLVERLDIVLGLGYERSQTQSEFRDWEGDDDLPIQQETRFTRIPLTLGVKAFPFARGRRISSLSWIPNRWNPYLGAGAGIGWYRFEQTGEFVDFETLDIFYDEFESKGSSFVAYLSAGLDYSLNPRWVVTGEARYSWGSAEMGGDFVGFDRIDLAGFRFAAGFAVRF